MWTFVHIKISLKMNEFPLDFHQNQGNLTNLIQLSQSLIKSGFQQLAFLKKNAYAI